jgi:flagellar motor switch protein FliG
MKDKHRSLRKAALLVASLDAERAEAILAQMSPAQADAVRQAVDALGPVDPREQSEVIEEFFRIGPLVPEREPSGIALDDPDCARLAVPPRDADPHADTTVSSLEDTAADVLAVFLAGEQSQTVALVLSRLTPERAADVLGALPAEMQREVARRLVHLEDIDDDVLAEIERALADWLRKQTQSQRRREAGLTALANILEAANPRTRENLLANLGRSGRGPSLEAEPPAGPPPRFAEVERLSGTALSVVLHHAPRELLVLALAGARPEFAARALEQFPPREAQSLNSALLHLGPTRLTDIEEAQRELALLVRQLEERGEIVRPRRDHLSVAV